MATRRQRVMAIATFVVGLLVLTVAGVALIADRQTVTTVDDAVAAFRAESTATPAGPTRPAPATGTSSSHGSHTLGAHGAAPAGEGSAPAKQAAAAQASGTSEGPTAGTSGRSTTRAPGGSSTGEQPRQAPQQTDQREHPQEPQEQAAQLTRPEEGVYVYATEGGERIAFGDASHRYPEETTTTVRHSDCGYTTRWEALEERWDQFDICGNPERSWMRQITLYHEFYERGMTHVYACGERSTIAAAGSRPGDRWTWECRTEGGAMRTTVDVVEFGHRDVGGKRVEAVHVRIHNVMTGDTEGERHADVWFARWTGLELRGEYHVDTQVRSPMGPTRYTEDLVRTLTSLQPRR